MKALRRVPELERHSTSQNVLSASSLPGSSSSVSAEGSGRLRQRRSSTVSCLTKKDSLNFFGGPARIRTGDRQVSHLGYEPAALSVCCQ